MSASALIGAIAHWAQGQETPALVIATPVMEENIAAMAAFAKTHGVALRPHAKSHKSIDIARAQMAAGAAGVCCAKSSEAHALVEAGFTGSILLTSPIASAVSANRVRRMHEAGAPISLVVDHPAGVASLAEVFSGCERPIALLIDVDPGIHRTGVANAQAAVELVRAIDAHPSLRYGGLQFYCGFEQHIGAQNDREAAVAARVVHLQDVIAALSANGFAPRIVTGSGTGTATIDAASGVFTELQAGSYVFLDRQYTDCEGVADGRLRLSQSLFVVGRVISCNTPGMATIDVGYKAMASDAGPPAIIAGPHKGARIIFMGDEHSAVISDAAPFQLGEIVVLQPSHCDPTVNLYDRYHVLDGHGAQIDVWPVTARGCSR